MKRKQESIWWLFVPLTIIVIAFVGTTIFTMIFMAKDNNYETLIFQYFNISRKFYGKLVFMDIPKQVLVWGMNLSSLAFFLGNYLLFLFIGKNQRQQIGLYIIPLLFWGIQGIIYSPQFQINLYFGEYGYLPNPVTFRRTYKIIHYITICSNTLIMFTGILKIIIVDLRKKAIPELLRMKRLIALIAFGIVCIYTYLFFSLPDSFLWMSRSTGYISYRSLQMAPFIKSVRLIIYLMVLLLGGLIWTSIRYQMTCKRIQQQKYVFSSIVASTEISSRAFSHYIKNEILGIMAETETLSARMGETSPELSNIKNACLEIFEHLNELQKNSNRIVLNKSHYDIVQLITEVVDANKHSCMKENCNLLWEKPPASVWLILDEHYIKEVLQNIIQNAMEAMQNQPGNKQIFISLFQEDGIIEISIRDTGPGLSYNIEEKLFDPFVSTKSTKRNWGIGLSFCRRIINSHGGEITAENCNSGGAVFRILLPQ